MHYNQVLFQELPGYYGNDLENNVWNLEHNAEKSQGIWNRIIRDCKHNLPQP